MIKGGLLSPNFTIMYHLQGIGVYSLQSYHWVLISTNLVSYRSFYSLQQLLIFVDILLQAKEHKAVPADIMQGIRHRITS